MSESAKDDSMREVAMGYNALIDGIVKDSGGTIQKKQAQAIVARAVAWINDSKEKSNDER